MMYYFKTLRKRGLALFLALMMCISLLPATALAQEVEEATHTCNEDGWFCTETKELICEKEEHTHGDACYATGEQIKTCELEESEGHTHDEACYNENGELICGQTESEGHEHGEECFTTGKATLICETEEHTHDGECYKTVKNHAAPSEAVKKFLTAMKSIPAEVTLADETAVTNARSAYDALDDLEKANTSVVEAFVTLTNAEEALAAAKAAASDAGDAEISDDTDISNDTAAPSEEITLEPSTIQKAPMAASMFSVRAAGNNVDTQNHTITLNVGDEVNLSGYWLSNSIDTSVVTPTMYQSGGDRYISKLTGKSSGTTTIWNWSEQSGGGHGDQSGTWIQYTVTVNDPNAVSRVYVYLKVSGDTSNIDWTAVNGKGWFTIGYVDVQGLPSATGKSEGPDNTYWDLVTSNLSSLVLYEANKDLFDLRNVTWTGDFTATVPVRNDKGEVTGTTTESMLATLRVSNGANDFSDANGNSITGKQWHLDGFLTVEQQHTITVQYVYDRTYTDAPQLPEATSSGPRRLGETFTFEIPQHDGYTVSFSDEDAQDGNVTVGNADRTITITYSKRNDLSYTVKYAEKNAQGNVVMEGDHPKYIAEDKVVSSQTFGTQVTPDTEGVKKTVEGYTYVDSDKSSITVGTTAANNVIILYYTRNPAYKLTVKAVLDTAPNAPIAGYSKEQGSLANGTTWSVAVNTDLAVTAITDNTGSPIGYTYPKGITIGENHYAYDSGAATGTIANADADVTLVYSLDANHDFIPDKYEAFVRFVSEDTAKGTVDESNTRAYDLRKLVSGGGFETDSNGNLQLKATISLKDYVGAVMWYKKS